MVKFVRVDEQKYAICRVFSGKVTAGDKLYLLGRKVRLSRFLRSSFKSSRVSYLFKALKDGSSAPVVTVDSVWALRGRDLVTLEVATAGVICAIDAQGLVQVCFVRNRNANLCVFFGLRFYCC